MKIKASLATLVLAFSGTAAADVAGFEAGAALWRHDPNGWVEDDDAGDRVDLDDDLRLDTENSGFFWVAIEHPVPTLPNLKLRYTPVEFSGSGTVSEGFTLDGVTFNVNERVDSEADLGQADVIGYYEVLDNVLDLDLGLNVKVIDATVRVTSRTTGRSQTLDFAAPLPLLYARAGFDLPLTGLSVGAELSGIAYSGNSITDGMLFVRYERAFLGAELGYRQMRLKLDDLEDVGADVDIGGAYAGVYADF